MDKFLRSFITLERTFQVIALGGVIFFLGYIALNNFQRGQALSSPSIAPAIQLK